MRMLPASLFGTLALTSLIAAARGVGDGIRVDVSKLGPPEKIYVYDYDKGMPDLERSIAPDSDEARAIATWLESHQDGWQRSFRTSITSYAPHRYVRGKRFSLNFTPGRFCILNYQESEGGPSRQVTRELAQDDPIPKVFHALP